MYILNLYRSRPGPVHTSKVMLKFDLKPINEEYRTIRLSVCCFDEANKNAVERNGRKAVDPEEPNPYSLPFSIGEPARLDAPLFKRPMYGVLCAWTSAESGFEGERFTLLGYIENGRFRPMDLSVHDIAFGDSGYRVADWLVFLGRN